MQDDGGNEEVDGGEQGRDWCHTSVGQKGRESQFRDLEVDDDHMATTNQLIANLGHELPDVRLRALKCLWRKLDCGLVSTGFVIQQTEILNRLMPWIRCDDPVDKNYEGFQLVIRLFTRLSQNDEFRKIFIGNQVDTLLAKRRLEFNGNIRSAINKLLDRVGSFYIHCEGPADDTWEGNKSPPSAGVISPMIFSSPVMANTPLRRDISNEDLSLDPQIPLQDFFPQQKQANPNGVSVPPWKKKIARQLVCIKNVRLGPSDRRVLSSAVDSLNSKNESLVYMTCCFVRDVLLNDFPAEVFIQEVAVSLSLAQIVQDSWMDERVNYTAYQALLKLAFLLRSRFMQLNSSDFYVPEGGSVSEAKGPQGYYGDAFPLTAADLSGTSVDYFAGNICKVMRCLSRSILFESSRVTRWILLDAFTATFLKCVHTFPNVSTKSMMLLLQEVLYDLKSSGDTYSNTYSNRPLVPYQPADDEEVIFGDYLLESLSYAYQGCLKDGSWEEPHKAIIHYLMEVQNSSGHKGVFDAVSRLKQYSFILYIKTRESSRLTDSGRKRPGLVSSRKELDMESIFRNPNWRDAFYRFLSVEPTSQEDEDLLCRVLDLLTFVINHVEGSSPLLEWMIPLCGTKGCAGLKLLGQHLAKINGDSSGTTLPTILRSLLDFYLSLLNSQTELADYITLLWELFGTFSQALQDGADGGYTSSASIFGILYGVANLSAMPTIQEKLQANKQFSLGLLHRVCDALLSVGERSSTDSFRNRGPIYYAAVSMLHVMIALNKIAMSSKDSSWEWIGKCVDCIPFLWSVEDCRARAAGFQMVQLLCRTTSGTGSLLAGLDPPALLWGMAYKHLADPREAPIVQHAAAVVFVQLLKNWDGISKTSRSVPVDFPLQIHEFVEDMLKLISNVYWHSNLNRCDERQANRFSKDGSDSSDDSMSAYSVGFASRSPIETAEMSVFITPDVLSELCKLFVSLTRHEIQHHSVSDGSSFEQSSFVQAIMTTGVSSSLFRLLCSHDVMKAADMNDMQWLRCCSAFNAIIESLICVSNLDRTSSVILIGDKRSLSHLIQLFLLRANGSNPRVKDSLSVLWINVFILLATLCTDAGKNFEDLERNVWGHWAVIYPRISAWLKNGAPVKCRQTAMLFTNSFLSMLTKYELEKYLKKPHPVLCEGTWKEGKCPYGQAWCQSLMEILQESIDAGERVRTLQAMVALFSMSASAKQHAIDKKLIRSLIDQIRSFGVKYGEPSEAHPKKRSLEKWHDEIIWILAVLTTLLYDCPQGRETALEYNMADNFHKVFKWWTLSPDRALLHSFIEALLNFTEEFQQGSHSLTLTTNLVGVAPRKVATPQSLLVEFINILQNELDAIDKNPLLKTIELCFSLLRNVSYSVECRATIAKTPLLSFVRRLCITETKKWGPKQHHVKEEYLKFLVHATINSDIQVLLAKVPECIEILLSLTEQPRPTSLLALKVLRNLSFNPGNRPRVLCDASFIPTIATKLRSSEDPEEIEAAAVIVWAVVANSEKGKHLAKKASCGIGISSAVQKLLQLQKSTNDLSQEQMDFTELVSMLSKVNNILGDQVCSRSN